MKIVQINSVCGIGSTGKIALSISNLLSEEDIENYVLYTGGFCNDERAIKCASGNYIKIQALKSRIFGNYGFNSKKSTQKIISELERLKPDIVHLHNIHGHDCDLTTLFDYFKKNKTKLVWTFHDAWPFTAYCPYFNTLRCDKWKDGCENCGERKKYSWFFDKSKSLYSKKKDLFSDLDLTIVTPSKWLCDCVKNSFLKNYPVEVINNGIDLSGFSYKKGNFREKYSLSEDKKIVLGISMDWSYLKGLDVFLDVVKKLPPEKYQAVMIGTTDDIDKILPKNVISIHRTYDQKELAEIYSEADVLLNTTRADNFPTVNIEALACGLPVITSSAGGSTEMLTDKCGIAVKSEDVNAFFNAVVKSCEENTFSKEDCISQAKNYDQTTKLGEYVSLYKRMRG